MAEARAVAILGEEFTQGTRVALSVDDEGLHLRTDITIPPPREAVRRLLRRMRRVYRAIYYSFFPFGPAVIFGLTAVVSVVVVLSDRSSWLRSGPIAEIVWQIGSRFPWLPGTTPWMRIGVLAGWTSLFALLLLAFLQRYLLCLLLQDKTFLYQARAPGAYLKVWGLLVKALTSGRALLYSYQSSLPRLPVPPLEQTVNRYLEQARLLQSPEDFAKTEEKAKLFLKEEGPRLQWYLKLKSWISSNYVTDWWEKYVYLQGRSSIAINSNYYVLDSGRWSPTDKQNARAATTIYTFVGYLERLENETIEPTMMQGMIPLCMWQFERMFSTSRIPGRECDENKHWDAAVSRHVAIYCKGSYYKLNVYRRDGSRRTPDELERILNAIQVDAASRTVDDAEASIPALTAENRTRWAEVRETYFSEGTNRRSLHDIESALFYIVLTDKQFPEGEAGWTGRGNYLIAADPQRPDIWFDKSVNLVVAQNGKIGLNCEHSWADAPVAAHLLEVAMLCGEMPLNPYGPDGHCRSYTDESAGCASLRNANDESSSWSRLRFQLPREAETAILQARDHLKALRDDLDLRVVAFTAYGKDFVKTCSVSPDAYIQMAMQLAYFRDQGHFDATYESSMTRLFKHGRTETVRPVTKEGCTFVRTMEDKSATPRQKLEALQAAARRHELGYKDAMSGKGIDRHLFALYVVSVGKKMDSPFLKGALSVPWRLSTSQQPQQQTTLWDIKDPKNARFISPGGGFGPVADDGYGVSYMVSGERELFFHVSSKRSCKSTDSERFIGRIFEALHEMKEIMQLAVAEKKAAASAKAAGLPAPAPAAAPAAAEPAPAGGSGSTVRRRKGSNA